MGTDLTQVVQIRVRGWLDARWSDWLGGMAVAHEIGDDGAPVTTITGAVVDQAALRGLLRKLWDLNLTLVSVICISADWQKRPSKMRVLGKSESEGT